MNNNEPIILGKVKKESAGKPMVIVIVFLFIGSIILFLPTIINYFGDYSIIDLIKNGQIIDFFTNHDAYVNKSIGTTSNTQTEIQSTKIILNSKTTIKSKNFTLTNFKIEKENIKFDINPEEKINFDEQNYYLLITKNNKTLSTIKLTGTVNQTSEYTFEFIQPLEDIVELEGKIQEITEFPDFIVSSDESGLGSLICEKDSYKIEYILNNNQLIKVKETFNYLDNGNESEYIKLFEEYTKISTEINNSNATATIVENYSGFVFTTDIDLSTYSSKKINYNYYSLNTKTNKINYEMTAKGYDCNEL